MELTYSRPCTLCPRACGVNRSAGERGFCRAGTTAHIARAGLHFGEEPPISGTRGSGTIFFCGCTLRCPFCQNHRISRDADAGQAVDAVELAELMLQLQAQGAHNINLVTATHYLPTVLAALDRAKPQLRIPVVYNCGGYESTETVAALTDYVDVWLPDLKYGTADAALRRGAPADYPERALGAIAAMVEQTGAPVFDADGMLRRGVIVRHLVLPGGRRDSAAALAALAARVDPAMIRLSLMRQYTPPSALTLPPPLNRRLTSFEYDTALAAAAPFVGYMQSADSADERFVPVWDRG
ncbi:MAG: radical SAM protein [Clostridia bacterium]|nr:radical SAM protein [Clostridia bacterium]